MLTKVLIFLAVVIGVFVVARMGAASAFRPVGKKARKKVENGGAEDLVACPACGAYNAIGQPCDCKGRG